MALRSAARGKAYPAWFDSMRPCSQHPSPVPVNRSGGGALHKIIGKGDETVICRNSFRRQKKVMRRAVKTIMGVLILAAGISIFLYPDYREWKNQREIGRITEGFQKADVPDGAEAEGRGNPDGEKEISEKETTEQATKEQGETISRSLELFTVLQEYNARLFREGQDITDAWNFRQIPEEIAALNPGSDAVGYIEISDISLSLPLYIGATEENMGKGAVVLTETSMPVGGENTNCVIAAHRGWGGSPYFRDIDRLKVGSEIHIHNLWEELTYQVTGTEIIHASECEILNIRQGKDMVTLFSCYPYMSRGTKYRLVIYCERVTEEEGKEKEGMLQEGTEVKELAEKELAEKGIVIEEDFSEVLSRKEDLLRVILPAVVILAAFIAILFRLKNRR